MTGRAVRRVALVVLVALVQLALVALVVAPRLAARLGGEEYRLRVAAYDPVDPFRGAYVALAYPDLRPRGDARGGRRELPDHGDVYVPLLRDGTVWRGGAWSRTRPRDAPYLTCTSDGWRLPCGIESWFTGQDRARVVGARLARAGGTATVRVDGRGHAALVALDAG